MAGSMYDRAVRLTHAPIGSTTQHVGPGTYDGFLGDSYKLRTDGYAPFLSMSKRDTFLTPHDRVIAAPGPGQYDPELPRQTIKGCSALSNKSRRFVGRAADTHTPGPGAYTTHSPRDWAPARVGVASAPPTTEPAKVNTSRVKFERKPEAPSIPTPGMAYGFEEADDGTLLKQDAPEKDGSLGPAYYNPYAADNKSSQAYRGVHFGRLTARRMDFGGKDGPGPGTYEPFRGSYSAAENVNMKRDEKSSTKYETKIPRYHEVIEKEETKRGIPGPGKYDVRGQFDPRPTATKSDGPEAEHPPFMTQSKRFGDPKADLPPPGSYNDPRTALELLRRVTGLKRSPFGVTAVRFNGDRLDRAPGPGAYTLAGMGTESMKRAYIESTRRGGFGSTAARIGPVPVGSSMPGVTGLGSAETPGPAHYQPNKRKPFTSRYTNMTSTFASSSGRLQEKVPPASDAPPPGSYDVERAFRATQLRRDPGPPRTGRRGAFLTGGDRFAPPRDVKTTAHDPNIPGPGEYTVTFPVERKGNPITARDVRIKYNQDETPGPGAYEFSPLIQDTVLKGTFNATLNNPVSPRLDLGGPPGGHLRQQPFLLGV